jgi:hypothetical protein
MLELGQITATLLNAERNEILVFFRDEEHTSAFLGNCDNIGTQKAIKILQIKDFGLYNNIIHSVEIDDFYYKYDILSYYFREIDPFNSKKYAMLCKRLHKKCMTKQNIGFRCSLLPDNIIHISVSLHDKQYTLEGDINYTLYLDDTQIVAHIDSNIPFMNFLIDDTYIDFTALMKTQQAKAVIGDITKGLINNYKFKILDTYNIDDIP